MRAISGSNRRSRPTSAADDSVTVAGWSQPLASLGAYGVVAVAGLVLAAGPLVKPLWEVPDGQRFIDAYWWGLGLAGVGLLWHRSGLRWLSWSARRLTLLWLLPAWAVASSLWSLEPAVTRWTSSLLVATTLFGMFIGYSFSPRQMMSVLFWFFSIFIVGSVVAALFMPGYGTSGYSGAISAIETQVWDGLTTHKQELGPLAAVAAVFFFIGLIYGRIDWRVASGGLGLALLAVFMSRSVTGYLMAAVGLAGAAAFVTSKRVRFPVLVTLVLLTGVVLFGMTMSVFLLEETVQSVDRDVTLSRRTEIWADAVEVVKERPLIGYGFEAVWHSWGKKESNWFPYLATTKWASHTHNGFLHIATILGLPAAIFAALQLIKVLMVSFGTFIRTGSAFVLFCCIYMLLFVILNLTETRLYQAEKVDWVMFVALTVTLLRSLEPQAAPRPSGRRPVKAR